MIRKELMEPYAVQLGLTRGRSTRQRLLSPYCFPSCCKFFRRRLGRRFSLQLRVLSLLTSADENQMQPLGCNHPDLKTLHDEKHVSAFNPSAVWAETEKNEKTRDTHANCTGSDTHTHTHTGARTHSSTPRRRHHTLSRRLIVTQSSNFSLLISQRQL